MRSSRSLGGHQSKREQLTQALNESRQGVNIDANQQLLYKENRNESSAFESSDESDELKPIDRENRPIQVPQFGSGLKRPLDADGTGNPILRKRQRLQRSQPKSDVQGELPWEGFSSDEDPENLQSPSPTTNSTGSQTDSEGTTSEDGQSSDEDGSNEESESTVELNEDDKEARKARSSAFKAWATIQVNEALGFEPSSAAAAVPKPPDTQGKSLKVSIKPRPPEHDPLPPELQIPKNAEERKVFHVTVERSSDVQEARMKLPIVAEEQKIMEAIHNNRSIVICGSTGSGKTTQVPQFLYEAGFGAPNGPNPGLVGVTQPRRVAAMSSAARVGDELGSARDKVSHQVRFDTSVSSKTAIKFMTDGILIREIAADFALLKYSVIIIDEAHERSVNTDILIGMLSRIVDLRASMNKEDDKIRPLKLVIMSAALRISDFLENRTLFRHGPPPLVQVEGRQYPVTTHFARRTQRDYVEEVFDKVCKGHRKLPPGGMLVFLTGKDEIKSLEKRLRATLAHAQGPYVTGHKIRVAASEGPLEPEDMYVAQR